MLSVDGGQWWDNSSWWLMIMKTVTNGMELARNPVVGGLVEGDQGHRAAVGDVRHEPGGEEHGVVEEYGVVRKVVRIKQIEEVMRLFMVIILLLC